MNNLKKLLAVILTVAMLVTVMVPAFAEGGATFTYTAEAQKLNDLGLYKGVSTETFDPDLGAALNRETGVVMLLRVFGLEEEAQAITDADATLAKFSDAASISSWAKNAVAYAVTNGLVQGLPEGTFGPKAALNGKAYATLILRQLGFTPDYNNATSELADKGGLTPEQATAFAGKELAKDDLVGMSFGALSATDKDGKKVIENLVANKVVDETAAVDAGLVTPAATPTPAPVAVALDVKSASSVTSKYVEVELNTAAKAEDVTAATFKVADAAAKEVAVKSQELAAYDADSKTVLLALEADTTAGTLYTLTCGTTSVKFGGKAVDTSKPTVSKIESTDYNEVTVTFSEAVKLEGASIVLAEKYGTKAALTVSNMKYNGKDKIVLSTSDQKSATLYGATITSVVDFAGNTMDKDDAKTFVGTGKSTDDLKVEAAASNNAEEVVIKFNVNVDPATIATTAFKVEESYGTKAVLTVSEARIATDDDKDTANAALTEATAKKHVILTVAGTKDATLYKVTASALTSLYGKALTSTSADTYKTFVGKGKPTSEMELAANPVTVNSNTSITITFPRKVDEAIAETVANYAIAEAYGTKAALTVTVAELQDNDTDVKLTVAAMKNLLYKVTITGLKDIYGNAIKTSDSKNVVSYAGKAVAAKIDAISDINRTDAKITDAATQICVVFDQAVGTTATDVSHYTIDNSVGYPEKAATVDGAGNEKKVILTLPKTTEGTIYKLTVKGLENADGVAMDSDGVNKTFVGKGNASGLPKVEAVLATDDYTIKVYFDRAVDGITIKDKIYTGNALIGNRLTYKTSAAAAYTDLLTLAPYVYKDDDNANVLVIRDNAASFDTTVSAIFDFKANSSYVDPDNDELSFAGNTTDAAAPEILSAMALDKNTVMIYFSEPIADYVGANAGIFSINTKEDGTNVGAGDIVAVNSRVKVDSKTYKLNVGALSNKTYYLRAVETGAFEADETISDIKDRTGLLELKSSTASATAADYVAVQFAGTDTAASDITDIAVMMTDTRTIEVYYPEAMTNGDPTDVTNADVCKVANYEIYKDDGDNALAVGLQPKAALYDSDNKKVTLVLDGALTGASNNTYYLAIRNTVKNATKVIGVDDDRTDLAGSFTTGVLKQFAISTDDPAKPTIKTVTVSSDNTRLTVEFENAVAFGNSTGATAYLTGAGAAAAANEFAVDGSTRAFGTPITFATYFTMTGTDVDNGAVTAPIATVRKSNTEVELVFAKAFKAGTSGTIKIKDTQADTATIFSMSKILVEDASADVQELSFGITTAQGDNTAPIFVGAAYLDSNSDGTVDKVALKFNEALSATAAQTVQAQDFTWVANGITASALAGAGTGTVAGDTITFTLSTLGNANITGAAVAPTIAYTPAGGRVIVDAAGNVAVAFAATNVADGAAPVAVAGVGTKTLSATSAQITFSENVVITTPAAGRFAVNVANTADSAAPAPAAAVVTLTVPGATFATTVASVVDYAPLAAGNAANVKDAGGNETAAFTDLVLATGF